MAKKTSTKKPPEDHSKHGRGTEADGPDEPDCACRGTKKMVTCAQAGCGFCSAAMKPPKHCDEYIDDVTQPKALRVWLARAREPAHGMTNQAPWPECYATWQGKTVRLTMASRLGSVGWSEDITQTVGYQHRGFLEELTNFRPRLFKNREELRAYVDELLEQASAEMQRKREAGICIEPECTALALKDNSVHFFGDDHCEEHAKKTELEFLIEDQKDDEESDEDYHKRTGEPRGAGTDWAGRTRGDFHE